MIRHLLEPGAPDFVVNDEDSGDDAEDFVEEVDLGHVVGRPSDSGLLDQKGQQTHERVQRVEALGPHLLQNKFERIDKE